ncbi:MULTISPECIES: ATP-binding protein [Bifidobacterium]|uniref:ATP-binding protein n=1 Tax=Bifidobacterium TaxID=1678 RepID=UPI001BDD6D78|nr:MULTISPECIES: ATP-binding protein [Bifidobacterium]MBT1162411.1 putative DNA binding domain-containing protein [Bifidobacterium sp. SO1]MBW3079637.1 putative DNA binding domain-containing protein [Bifidobacterium simiiventris]
MLVNDLISGESKNVEYKVALPDRSIKYVKTAVAFANGEGGRIVFGVEDQTLNVVGVPDDQVFTIMDAISNAIADSCEPLIIPDIFMRDIGGKTVIVAEILPGAQRPYYIKSMGRDQGTFVRVAGTTRQADAATIKELLFEGSNRSFDQTVCLGLEATDEDVDKLCEAMTDVAKTNAKHDVDSIKPVTAKQLLSWGVLVERDGELKPTNAYAILSGINSPVRSIVQCGVFKGSTKAVFVDRREFTGAPWELVEQAYQYVLRNIHMGARFEGVYRQDVYEIPPDAIRELIVNAVVHRSYIDHSSIQIAIYDDRLEITSPGRLPMGQTIARMKEGYSKIRNEALAAAFSYMRLIEHWGSGVPRIIEEVREAGLREPEFLGGDTDLRINIYRQVDALASDTASGVRDTTETVRDTASGVRDTTETVRDTTGLTDDERAVIHYAQANGGITSAVAKNVLNLQERQTQKILAGLVNRGILHRIGAARSTRYVLAETTTANENRD